MLWDAIRAPSAGNWSGIASALNTSPRRPTTWPGSAAANDRWPASSTIPNSTQRCATAWPRSGRRSRSRAPNGAHPDDASRHVSARTIYAWIEHDVDKDHWKSFLRRRGKRPYRRKPTANSCHAARIHHRPEVIEQRLRLGDFEGDTVLGPAGTGGLATLVDRNSRFTIITKIQSKDAEHVHQRIKQRLKELAEERRHSITFDNGTEFARCQRLEKHLDMQLYFADPGCPYQRGTNENTNGLIRQYFPKGTDFRTISHSEVRRVENLLNTRPRACLDFETPAAAFHEESSSPACN